MTQCNAGHFYDEGRHAVCPYCGVPFDVGGGAKTVPVRPTDDGAATAPVKTVPIYGGSAPPSTQPVTPQGATVRLIREQLGIDPVVGWLVCLEGPDKGRDFRLHSEKNFIGRETSMDVCLSGDQAVSRLKHAAVAFEPNERAFWLVPGDSGGLVYLNGSVSYQAVKLNDRDVITLGKSKLALVSFVDERFNWQA
jgi:hypothetical protein